MNTLHLLATTVELDTEATTNQIRTLVLAAISIILLLVSAFGVWKGRKGEPGENASIVAAVLIALIPGAIAVAGIGLSLGAAFLGWVIPGINA